MSIVANNVTKMFMTSTLLEASSNPEFKKHMMEYHGLTSEHYDKFFNFYSVAVKRLIREEKILFSENDITAINEMFKEDKVVNVL